MQFRVVLLKDPVALWKLYCLAHNIEKLAHHGYAQ